MTNNKNLSSISEEFIPFKEISDQAVLSKIPLVSIHMPTYNHEPYIAQAIEGVVKQQTDFPIELIIAEDCSTDHTADIALKYRKRYSSLIRVITFEKNVGMMNNFFRTHSACRGRYIAFCEGDDYWIDPFKLQKQVDFLEANLDCSWCFHSSKVVFVNGCGSGYISKPRKIPKECKFELKDIILGGGSFFATASTMFVADSIRNLPDWFMKAYVGDTPLALLASMRGKIGFLPDVMCVYRANIKNSWSERIYNKNRIIWYKETIEYLNDFNKYSHYKYNKYVKRRIINIKCSLFLYFLQNGPNKIYSTFKDFKSCYEKNSFMSMLKFLWAFLLFFLGKTLQRVAKITKFSCSK